MSISSSSFPSFPRTIVSYTVTTSLFVVIFLCSVFLFTRRTLEPSLSPYHTDIPLPASDPRPSTPLLPPIEHHDAANVTVETNPKEEGDSRGDDVAVETELKAVEDSRMEKNKLGEEKGSSSGEVSVESNDESVDQAVIEKMRGCDLYRGSWIKDDDEYPLYQPGSCPYVDEAFDCQRNGRRDSDYLNWRWKPDGCDLPRFNATDFLVKLRGKKLMLVGDSMNRNQFESMLCVLREGLSDKSRMHEVHGHNITKGRGYFSFNFEDYNCTVDFVRSHFLVREGVRANAQGNTNPTLSIDRIDKTNARWKRADILVFNTGHWWVHGKTARGKNYYKEGDYIYPKFDATEAYRRSLKTWAKWIDANVNPKKQLVFYRGYSSAHFRGGEWDSGGSCNGEVEPVKKGSILDSYPLKMKIVEEAIKEMQVPVVLLNVTKLTNFRKDGHPSIYGKINTEGKKVSTRRQDCSHWCLPGVPDVWNHLIYASLLLQAHS
ncbi:Protein trichome birefringence-like 5 [Cardamine amara subsp. amara]|uniref:Protein trichome birefringence-like 5 n=1 Tax=Cardamine amara subsp. amara TaxID=228776 RepID=A0ABD0Z3M4_CARAN